MAAVDIVDGWEVRERADGGFGVYDSHGLVAGPFGMRNEALEAALKLPRQHGTRLNAKPAPLTLSEAFEVLDR